MRDREPATVPATPMCAVSMRSTMPTWEKISSTRARSSLVSEPVASHTKTPLPTLTGVLGTQLMWWVPGARMPS